MNKENGGPAFPEIETDIQWLGEHGEDGAVSIVRSVRGATLRDYFAAHAPAAPKWWLTDYIKGRQLDEDASVHAQWAWSYADAMLKTR